MKKFIIIVLALITLSSCTDHEALWDAIDDLQEQVCDLQKQVDNINSYIINLQVIVNKIENGGYITNIEYLNNGYNLHFSDGSIITITNGQNGINGSNGEDGKDGKNGTNAPVIGIKQFNNIYYWTITIDNITDWLLDDNNNKIPVSGINGQNGTNGITPIISIDSEGYWVINYGNGNEYILDNNGNRVHSTNNNTNNSPNISISEDNNNIYIVTQNGEVITIPKSKLQDIFKFDVPNTCCIHYFSSLEVQTIAITKTNVESIIAYAPIGWKVKIVDTHITITACDSSKEYNETSGIINFLAFASDGRVIVRSLSVQIYPVSGGGSNDPSPETKNYTPGDIYYYDNGAMMGVVIEETSSYITIAHINGTVEARFTGSSSINIISTSKSCGIDNKEFFINRENLFPAWNYCISQTGDDWYLPAWDEMVKIYSLKSTLNNVLRTPINNKPFWTSTLSANTNYIQQTYPSGSQNITTIAQVIPIKRIYKWWLNI